MSIVKTCSSGSIYDYILIHRSDPNRFRIHEITHDAVLCQEGSFISFDNILTIKFTS